MQRRFTREALALAVTAVVAGCAGAPPATEAPAPPVPVSARPAREPEVPVPQGGAPVAGEVRDAVRGIPSPPRGVPEPEPGPTRLVVEVLEVPPPPLTLPPPSAPVGEAARTAGPPPAEPLRAPPEAPVVAPGPVGLPIPERAEVRQVLEEFCGPRSRSLAEAFRRGGRYLPMIRSVLAEEGLPEELAYLALVESAFHPAARSPADAVGLWQFIESTGRASGLRIDWWVDERLDPEASTRAAARHLKELFARFGDWPLALAAYNAGPGGVDRALASCGGEGFWDLVTAGVLRAETRRYVPKFYAAVAISRDPESHGFAPGGEAAPLAYETAWVDSPVDLRTAARLAGVSLGGLRELNPALARGCTPPGEQPYPLRVPVGAARGLVERLAAVPPAERVTFQRYAVRPGDTLWGISRTHGAPAQAVAELNGIADPRTLRPGQELVIPTPAGGQVARGGGAPAAPAPRGSHLVRPGETVWGIARAYGVSSADVIRWNGLGRQALVRPGDRLIVAAAPAGPARAKPSAGARRLGEARVHVVREGDSLWGISRRYGVSLSALLERNGLEESSVLRPGDRLLLEGGGPS